jgi:predicted nucleotidyltransferase
MPASDRERIVEALSHCVDARPEIQEAYLFGSGARAGTQPHSDVDVAVYVDPERVPTSGVFGYAAALTVELVRALRRDDVDVVVLNQASPLLYHRVLRDGIRIFSRDLPATTTREGRALSRYCDYVPHLRKIERAHAARIERGSFGR